MAVMLDLLAKPKTHTPPPKIWRNYYHVYRVLSLYRLGTIFPGLHAGPSDFPTKEIAEEHAKLFLSAINPPGRHFMDFAGAYPEGDAAN
ncbi:MAG: hypothetical protein JNL81_03120 [Hyphomonadaceae bacterium]|nr:hypothetical protein [Hyphomonadaceae bacterium]